MGANNRKRSINYLHKNFALFSVDIFFRKNSRQFKYLVRMISIVSLVSVVGLNSAVAEDIYEIGDTRFCIQDGYVNGYTPGRAISISAYDLQLLPNDLRLPVLTDVEIFITIQESEEEWSSGIALGTHLGTNIDYSGSLQADTVIYVNDFISNTFDEVEIPYWFMRSSNYVYRTDLFESYLGCSERMNQGPLSQNYGCIVQAETQDVFLEGIVDIDSLMMVDDFLKSFELLVRSFSCEDGEVR